MSHGKEVNQMNYQKPEIVVMTSAISCIQGCSSKGGHVTDCDPNNPIDTVGAYEADE
jgi:hypothetical protein